MSNSEEVKLPLASSLQQVVGALLFGADHPLSVEEIRGCLKSVAELDGAASETAALFAEASPREIGDAVESIAKELSRLELGIEVTELNGGFRFQTQPSCGRWVRNLLKMDRPNNLSRPALETLAIIAYRQPIAKSEIESIRGVTVDHIVKALMELHLIRIVGRSELPGRPFLYGTTATFLNHFGLSSLKELNELDPTLQRSKLSERKALHKKEKKAGKESADEATLFAPRDTAAPPDAPAPADAVKEILGGDAPPDAEPVFDKEGEG
ncbi:MAG: SMC-Scp complex subunit ScpB [Kiritimatiellia bacterium]|jgi:segregation and condensation protein B|nr:SMC-Scp complex subunit ScpB [Kiritimatiellia bacterium]MDD4172858.1 SMC-Scp complex subunit ScpB [Kiritimatiellia bacterium]MDD4441601.1 SMC-Scp complex subunit ScpB [Kiritimatiellia bacterium]NLC81697.1 SMC-Scp complex subunit ScpB [Lentisphaerota bacterium]